MVLRRLVGRGDWLALLRNLLLRLSLLRRVGRHYRLGLGPTLYGRSTLLRKGYTRLVALVPGSGLRNNTSCTQHHRKS